MPSIGEQPASRLMREKGKSPQIQSNETFTTPVRTRDFKGTGVTLQLFLFVFLPFTVLLLVVTFGSLSIHNQAMRSLVGDRDLRAIQEASGSLQLALSHQAASIELMADLVGSQTSLAPIQTPSQQVLLSFNRGIALFAPDGRRLAASQDNLIWQNYSLTGDGKFIDFLRKAQSGVSFSPAIPAANGGYIMLVAAPTPGGQILVGGFDSDALIRGALKGIMGSGQMGVWVVTPQDQIIYESGSLVTHGDLFTRPGMKNALGGESGINYIQTNQGEHVIAFSPVEPVGWGLVLEESWESISSPLLRTTQLAPLILVPVVLLMLVALWFGLHQIVQPLRELQIRASELANGDFETIQKPVGGVPEIQNLQGQLVDMAGKLEEAQESLHDYIGAITAGVENERRSLARELHDDTLQALIALNQRLQMASLNPSQDQKAFDQVQNLVQQTISNLRRMVRGLRPIYLEDLGLVASLGMLVNEVKQNQNINLTFDAIGQERRLQPEVEMALYRITQEALNNVVRHAHATKAWVQVEYQPEKLHLMIRDNGLGFAPPQTPSDFARYGHYGLLGLFERAELIQAQLRIVSKSGNGTSVSVDVNGISTDQMHHRQQPE